MMKLIKKIKLWIFQRRCLGTHLVNEQFPCYFCKEWNGSYDTEHCCRFAERLKL